MKKENYVLVAGLVAIALVMVLPSVNYAQSGWILWDKTSIEPSELAIGFGKPNPDWTLIHAYRSYEECEAKADIVAAGHEKIWREQIGKPATEEGFWSALILREVNNLGLRSYVVTWQAKGPKGEIGRPLTVFHELTCFPATFDPRKK